MAKRNSKKKRAKKTAGKSAAKGAKSKSSSGSSSASKRKAGPKRKAAKKRTDRKKSSGAKEAVRPSADATKDISAAGAARKGKRPVYATAESMAKSQRSISVSEFFAKNRHLLGFDNPRKALLTSVREAVDNALDACEEAGVLPVIRIAIEQIDENHYKMTVEDNGPGIVRKQIPNIFGKLLYGSKFHRLQMSRGQQGIGISAAGMYGLLTTGRPVRITSRTSRRAKPHFYELQIDTRKNQPDIITDETVEWDVAHGTKVEIELEARYQSGRQSVDDYLHQTAIANPHVTFHYTAPDGREEHYEASVKVLPDIPRAIRPHPHGIELGVLIKMLADTKARNIQQFLTSEFSRVSPRVAKEIIATSGVRKNARTKSLSGQDAKSIYRAIQNTKIMSPATDCVVPIGEDKLIAGLSQVVDAGFYTAVSRSPSVYRGNPFIVEAAIAYGKPEPTEEEAENAEKPSKSAAKDKTGDADADSQLATLYRYANRVPLQYQQSACAVYKAVAGLNWKTYGLTQGRGALPSGPLTIVVHVASVWVPFTSESKEAIASYPEILKELRLALQECGRKLGRHIRKAVRVRQELKKRSYIQKYIPAIGEALRDILDLKDKQVDRVCGELKDVLERSRKM